MAMTYSKTQAYKLLRYYKPLLLDKSLHPATGTSIDFLGLEPALRDSFQVYAYGQDQKGKKIKRPLHRVAQAYGYGAPEEIVKYLSLMHNFE